MSVTLFSDRRVYSVEQSTTFYNQVRKQEIYQLKLSLLYLTSQMPDSS